MSSQILDRSESNLTCNYGPNIAAFSSHNAVNQMSTRVDALEASIQDIINADAVTLPQSPAPGTPGSIRRSDDEH